MHELLAWLTDLPDFLLYCAIAGAAFVENIFPPLPADTAIALGAFVAARGNGTLVGVWAATMVGNVGGALVMYLLGFRFGLPWLATRFPSVLSQDASERFVSKFARQGIVAVFISRFLPAVRAVVPPVAGALGIGVWRTVLAMSVASGIWYGALCLVAFRAASSADVLLDKVSAQQRWIGVIAAVAAAAVLLVWWLKSRRASTSERRHK